MKKLTAALALSLLGCRLIAADVSADNYGNWLVNQAGATHSELIALTLAVVPPKGARRLIVASKDHGDLGKEDAGEATATRADGNRVLIRLPLLDVGKDAIGVLSATYTRLPNTELTEIQAKAAGLRDQLARHISHAANLLDSVPYDADAPQGARGQQLEERVLAAHPDIAILVIHATPPKSDYNVVVGSNIGRIGKKADNDDMRCVYTGKPNLEVNAAGNRFESEMQLHDAKGRVIGALGVVYAYKGTENRASLHAKAESVRHEIEPQIPDSESLFLPQQ